jgi:hypothetical protein
MIRIDYHRIAAICMVVLLAIGSGLQAQQLDRVVDLNGLWKFSIGDDPHWADPDYNDSGWEQLRVPGSWEEQGFHGYDGYAWYRKTFTLPKSDMNYNFYLQLGFIDDVDEVYLNGKKIGHTGQFPPQYTTAFNAWRLYMIPQKYLYLSDKITVAVRVYDQGGAGGIVHGKVGLMVDRSSVLPELDLQGDWKFRTGFCADQPESREYENWENIVVPGIWEDQGHKNYDGTACYVTEFDLENKFRGKRMVLLLGKIDDLDMVYINGTLIGQSGDFEVETVRKYSEMYKQQRGYYIPPDVLKENGTNVLVVKVLDYTGLGGIWDGSVGLITQDKYIEYWRKKRNSINNY